MPTRHQSNHTLLKITVGIALVCVAAGGTYYGIDWLRVHWTSNTAEASAPNIETARELLTQGKVQEARELLRPIATNSHDASIAPAALILLAEIDRKAGDKAQAMAYAERAATEFPKSPDHPKALAVYAKLLEDSGKVQDALALFEEINKNAPPELRAPALAGLGRQKEREQKVLDARALYAEAVSSAPWNSDGWNEGLDALGRVNVQLIFSPGVTPESKTYTVAKGDSITSIGNKLNTTQGLLLRANGLSEESRLHIGQTMKWTPKDFRIVIERSTCRLFLLDNSGIFKRYQIGLGMPGHETTLGSFTIGNKEKDPTWHKPGEGPIPAGDPGNELGTRWMPWVPVQAGLPHDLGLHGTIHPETIGGYTSHGCARMRKEDVEEVYDLVVRSTPVQVVDVINPGQLGKLAVPTA